MNAFSVENKCLNCEHCYAQNPLFSLLSEEELDFLNATRAEVFFKKGETIYKQGMPFTHLVLMKKGFGKIYIQGDKGKSLILNYTKPHDMNGGIGLFIDRIHHSTLKAATDCETCFVDMKSFKQVLHSNAEFMEAYLRDYSQRVLRTYHQFALLTQKNMEGRMAESILYLHNHVFKNGSINNVSKQDLAEFTAMSRESAIRVIKEFKDEGILNFEGQAINILDEEALQKIASKG